MHRQLAEIGKCQFTERFLPRIVGQGLDAAACCFWRWIGAFQAIKATYSAKRISASHKARM
jgi:hypothetical protein